LRILMMNHALNNRGGSELYIRDIALALRRAGHHPMAFSTELGDVAEEIRGYGIPVVDDLDDLPGTPDLLHCQHHLESMMAILRFPGVPAVYVCHGVLPWQAAPFIHPRILRYVAVDEPTRQACLETHGVPPERMSVILNFVDLDRFRPRDPLPPTPKTALLFYNSATDIHLIPEVREACHRTGIHLDVVGLGVGRSLSHPEAVLGSYDLVFAKGRSALEAMAVGAAVVLLGDQGVGPMVTPGELNRLRPLNFGFRTLTLPATPENIVRQIQRYNAGDAAEVSNRIRSSVGLDRSIQLLLGTFDEAIAEYRRDAPDEGSEARAASDYVKKLAGYVKKCYALEHHNAALERLLEKAHDEAPLGPALFQALQRIRRRLSPPNTLRDRFTTALLAAVRKISS
jgi:hypothetical protein